MNRTCADDTSPLCKISWISIGVLTSPQRQEKLIADGFFWMQLVFLETTQLPMVSLASFCLRIPSRKLTYPNVGKGKSSTQKCLGTGYVSSQEGIFPHLLGIPRFQPSCRQDTAAIAHLTPAAVDGFSSVLPGAEYAAVHPPQF